MILLFRGFIPVIFGSQYDQTVQIVPFLLLIPLMYTVSESTCLGISFMKKTNVTLIVSGVALIVNVILNIILIPRYQGVGAAIATGLSYVVFFILRTYFSQKYYYVKYKLLGFMMQVIFLVVVMLIIVLNYNGILENILITILIVWTIKSSLLNLWRRK
jgi:O-antigen/teichoic acid export membrane protein